jgi:hypothetical protein
MISKYIVLPLLAIGLISGTYVALQPSDASAAEMQAQHAQMGAKRTKHDLTPEQREAMRQAMKDCNYTAWKEIVGEKPITQKINESNFPKFCEATKLLVNGDKDAAIKLFKELGIKPPFHHKHKHGPHRPGAPRAQAEQPKQ